MVGQRNGLPPLFHRSGTPFGSIAARFDTGSPVWYIQLRCITDSGPSSRVAVIHRFDCPTTKRIDDRHFLITETPFSTVNGVTVIPFGPSQPANGGS